MLSGQSSPQPAVNNMSTYLLVVTMMLSNGGGTPYVEHTYFNTLKECEAATNKVFKEVPHKRSQLSDGYDIIAKCTKEMK